MKSKGNLGIVPQIKAGGEYKPCSDAEITLEDIKGWKAQLDADLPKRKYVDIIGIKKRLNKLIKQNGLSGIVEPLDENWNTF